MLSLAINDLEDEEDRLVVGANTLEPLNLNDPENVNLTFTVDEGLNTIEDVHVFFKQQQSNGLAPLNPTGVAPALNANLSRKISST